VLVHDTAVRRPLLDAQPEGLPHIRTGARPRLCRTLPSTSQNSSRISLFGSGPNPKGPAVSQWRTPLSNFCFCQPNLIHAHLRRFAPAGRPPLQIPQIDCARCSPPDGTVPPPAVPADSRRLAHGFQPLAEGGLARQRFHLPYPHSAARTSCRHQSDPHACAVLKARQIKHFPLKAHRFD
jgi:hypothetical protein